MRCISSIAFYLIVQGEEIPSQVSAADSERGEEEEEEGDAESVVPSSDESGEENQVRASYNIASLLCISVDSSSSSRPHPDNSPPGQFPTVQVLFLMSGFIPW